MCPGRAPSPDFDRLIRLCGRKTEGNEEWSKADTQLTPVVGLQRVVTAVPHCLRHVTTVYGSILQ